MSPITLLSLPNETLDHVIRFLAGEPALYQPPHYSGNETVHSIRLVNRRLASLGSYYILFRHRCASERQLKHETAHLTQEGKLRRRYTRQLDIENVPVLYWLSALQNLYPIVTHMTLTNTRFSPLTSQNRGTHSPYLALTSVRYLSIRVNNINQTDIPGFLRSFPNLNTLLLDSDAFRYTGMDTKLLLSFPPLPHLRTLSRPPLKRTHLTFSTDLGYTYANTHQHPDFRFHEFCNECQMWSQSAESSERITVTQLAWQFPSLREVLIPRLVFEDWMRIPGLSSDHNLPLLDGSKGMEGLDWIECMRQRSDVAAWLVVPDTNEDCTSERSWKRQCVAPGMATPSGTAHADPHGASATAPLDDTGDEGLQQQPPFRVMQPWEYTEHTLIQKQKGRRTLIEVHPKFWWTSREKKASFLVHSSWHTTTGDVVKVKDSSRAKIFGPGDL